MIYINSAERNANDVNASGSKVVLVDTWDREEEYVPSRQSFIGRLLIQIEP